eukprot:gene21219-22544_t
MLAIAILVVMGILTARAEIASIPMEQYNPTGVLAAIATAVSKIPLLQHKQIHFVHVPKTGGTSIEDFGKSHGRLWGRFAPSAGCKHGRECTLPATVPGTPPPIKECVHWHIPPKYKVLDGAENATYFTVLREPFSRLISQATYLTGMLHTFKTCAGIDNYVYQKVSTFKANGHTDKFDDCHWLPQSEYLLDTSKVMMYDTLELDFDRFFITDDDESAWAWIGNKPCKELENEGQCKNKLNVIPMSKRCPAACGLSFGVWHEKSKNHCTVGDLAERTKALIREVYAEDFVLYDQHAAAKTT